jgi:hypothetical protein
MLNTAVKKWIVETGDFEILTGTSSGDIKLKESVNVTATNTK